MTMTKLSREDVVRIVGDMDDIIVARLVGTGATVAELREAVAEVQVGEALGEPTPEPSTPRVAQLRAILRDVLDAEEQPLEYE
jgi:hypothetical protein